MPSDNYPDTEGKISWSESVPTSILSPSNNLPYLPGFDTSVGMNSVGGNARLYLEILSKFARSQRNTCHTMLELVKVKDFSTLELTAHTLRGIAATIGATALNTAAQKIEHSAREGILNDQFYTLLEYTSKTLDAVLLTIDTAIPKQQIETICPERIGKIIDMTALTFIFKQTKDLLKNFDSNVETVVNEMEGLVQGSEMHEHYRVLKQFVDCYDYDGGLNLLQEWAKQVGVPLE